MGNHGRSWSTTKDHEHFRMDRQEFQQIVSQHDQSCCGSRLSDITLLVHLAFAVLWLHLLPITFQNKVLTSGFLWKSMGTSCFFSFPDPHQRPTMSGHERPRATMDQKGGELGVPCSPHLWPGRANVVLKLSMSFSHNLLLQLH